ncbi:MAG TPA: hypothetical protein VFP19_04275 [Candidatus Limnocylindrales bacterium]|nr:hypothetical protein [Candidatus Limnocylindrales bacterium]
MKPILKRTWVSNPAGWWVPHSRHARLGLGATHWFGRGRYGWWGKRAARPRMPKFLGPVDQLQNPGNGEIMPTTNTHLIFWIPAGFHYEGNSAGDAAYEAAMQKYFQDVGGSQILNTTTQYPGNNGTPADTSTYIDSVIDTTAFPHTGADVAHAVTQGDLNQEVFNQIGANSWPTGLSDMYFVFLPDNVVDCDNGGVNCNTNAYCAYHTRGWSGSDTPANDFIWADIPVNRGIYTSGGCGNSNVTGDNEADTTLSSVEHEQMEAITDPRGNAWQDSTGGAGENGDKCNRNMGVANSSSSTVNNFLGTGAGDFFRIQREWSNAAALGPAAEGCAASYTTTGSNVETPNPTGSDVTASVTESTIQGNNGDQLHYHVSFKNPSDQDDAFSVSDSASYASAVSGPGSTTLGNLAPHKSASGNLTASVTGGPLLDGTVLTSTFTTNFDDSTGTAASGITRTATTTVVNAQPTLTVPGAQSQDYHDSLTFGISATDPDSGDTVALSATGLPAGLSLADNGDGTGTVSGTITATPGVYTATFSADDHHHVTPVTATVQITVTKEETTTAYTGPTVIAQGFPVTLQAQLLQDGTTAPSPSGQTLTMSLGVQSCTATVDASGNAQCSIGTVSAPLGASIPISATFGGDTYYLSSFDNSKSAVVFAFPSRGAFDLGDVTVASAGPSTLLTWWSSGWSGLNQLSGGPAPSGFKGFAGVLTPSAPPACSGTWTTGPGNSPPPVGTIPSYMGVLVSSSVHGPSSTYSGDTPKIVVVKTNPGYAPNPGHPGTGTYVATYCG